jgi:hypothetical protein
MLLEIGMSSFYSIGDERRFFQGLKDISSIKDIRGVGRGLILQVDIRSLNKESLRELMALLWRYGISLSPLRVLAANNKKFAWLNDERCYWYKSMFDKPMENS